MKLDYFKSVGWVLYFMDDILDELGHMIVSICYGSFLRYIMITATSIMLWSLALFELRIDFNGMFIGLMLS